MTTVRKGAKQRLVIVCKTYRDDLGPFQRFLTSFQRHNADNIPLYVSVPEADLSLFEPVVANVAHLLTDESYASKHFVQEQHWGLSLGYLNQEICKLSFWETGVADNYLCVDSDTYFIRDFHTSDFMADEQTPYSVLVMDKDLYTEPFYAEYGRYRAEQVKKIFDIVGCTDRRMRTCHGMTVFNTNVLASLKNDFMRSKGWQYGQLLEQAPFEYSWYNAWLQTCRVIDVVAVEPFFKTYHMRIEYDMARLRGMNEAALATQYVGVVLNSNWQPRPAPERFEEPGRLQRILRNIVEKVG